MAVNVVARSEGETHLRHGTIGMAAQDGCHGALRLVRRQRTIKTSSWDDDFSTNPRALSILASFGQSGKARR
jgi:hypothetical protein